MGIRRCIAIVNPRGGSRKGLSMLDDIKRSFSDAGVILDAHVTKHPGHAIQLAREIHLADYDCLCVVGGDGTVHDVVGGLMLRNERPDIPLGLIPAGTGYQNVRGITVHETVEPEELAAAAEAASEAAAAKAEEA